MSDEGAPAAAVNDAFNRTIVQFLLGRNPSLQHLHEMRSQHVWDNFIQTITSQEFLDSVGNTLVDSTRITRNNFALDFNFKSALHALINNIPLSDKIKQIANKPEISNELLTILLIDKDTTSSILDNISRAPARFNRFKYFLENLNSKIRKSDQGLSPKDENSPFGADMNTRPLPSPPNDNGIESDPDPTRDYSAIFAEADFGLVKSALDKIFSSKSFDTIASATAVEQIRLLDGKVGAYARMMLARTYIRLFLGESAFRTCEEMVARGDLEAMDHPTKRRFRKTHAMAALRGGRAAMGKALFRDLYYSDPSDTDAGYSYADAISSESPDIASAVFSSCLAHGNLTKPQLLFVGDFAAGVGDMKNALAAYSRLPVDFSERGLLAAKIAARLNDYDHWLSSMNMFYEENDLVGIKSFGGGEINWNPISDKISGPLVSVIMTAHNTQDTILQAIQSILDQSYDNIEIFIIDDCSTDSTGAILQSLSGIDKLFVLYNTVNVGTYCSKNRGIRRSSGKYITFHDSDDWMHPERIARHVDAMHSGAAMSISNWFRMTNEGIPIARRSVGGFLHKNPASTFFARKIFDRIGHFDSVRVGADTEMLSRVRRAYGHQAVVDMNDPLSIGLHHLNSLTQSGSTAFDEFRFSPVRSQYAESWVRYHVDQPLMSTALNLTSPESGRRFLAPEGISVTHYEE
jgi:hypothetical protein